MLGARIPIDYRNAEQLFGAGAHFHRQIRPLAWKTDCLAIPVKVCIALTSAALRLGRGVALLAAQCILEDQSFDVLELARRRDARAAKAGFVDRLAVDTPNTKRLATLRSSRTFPGHA
jgi:hypothetical protein